MCIRDRNRAIEIAKTDFNGLCFVNLVDFDSIYGHRRDPIGYGKAIKEFDLQLEELMRYLKPDDLLMISSCLLYTSPWLLNQS